MERAVRPGQVQDLPYNLPNLLVNPGFEIWQRGTSFSTLSGFSADEWRLQTNGTDTLTTTKETSVVKAGTSSLKAVYTKVGPLNCWVLQGLEAYKSLEGLTLTLSIWVRSSVVGTVQAFIGDNVGASQVGSLSSANASADTWEQLIVTRTIRTGLSGTPVGPWPHNFPLVAGVKVTASCTFYMDGATLTVGTFPEGIPYVPDNPDNEIQKCKRFFDIGELSVTGVEKSVRNWQGSDNLLINPGLEVWQRGVGPFSMTALSGRIWSADEWQVLRGQSGTGTFTCQRSSSAKFGEYCASISQTVTADGSAGQIRQGIECFKSLEGLYLTFCVWAKTSVANALYAIIWDRVVGSWEGSYSAPHTGSGNWERLVAVKKIRTSLNKDTVVPPHDFPLTCDVRIQDHDVSGALVDGATLVVGNYPDGVPYVAPNVQDDLERCYRFFFRTVDAVRVVRCMAAASPYYGVIPGYGYYPVPMYAVPTVTTYPNSSYTGDGYVRVNISGAEHNEALFDNAAYLDKVVYWNTNTGPLHAVGDYYYCWYDAEVS